MMGMRILKLAMQVFGVALILSGGLWALQGLGIVMWPASSFMLAGLGIVMWPASSFMLAMAGLPCLWALSCFGDPGGCRAERPNGRYGLAGNTSVKFAPLPGSLSTVSEPFIASASLREI